MGNRPRIKKELIGNLIMDETRFTHNKSQIVAKKVSDKSHLIEIEIWCTKHYYNRVQLGDENGERKGIDEGTVKKLVSDSLQHLFYYSFKLKTFTFINFDQSTRNIRTVIQAYHQNGMLNVVTEFHHLEKSKYEVTVITAMQEDSFSLGVAQFALEIMGDSSVLRKYDGKKLDDVDIYN